MFYGKWSKYDPHATQFITFNQVGFVAEQYYNKNNDNSQKYRTCFFYLIYYYFLSNDHLMNLNDMHMHNVFIYVYKEISSF